MPLKGPAAILMLATLTAAAEMAPGPAWKDAPNPLASPRAVTGGTMSIYPGPYPQSFNYYLDNNSFSAEVFGALYETLLSTSPTTAEYEPALACRWSISDDKKAFTFWIDPAARWSDGKPVTAGDVKWTFQAIMDTNNLTGVHKVALETFAEPEVLASNAVRFTAREVHWRNLGAAGGFPVLPRHVYASQDFNKLNFEFPVVSGPYRIEELKEGISLKLARREDWWARPYKRYAHTGNFDQLSFRFYADNENAFEAFKKGLIDLYPVYTARIWINETTGDRFEKNWILKQKVRNYNPIGFQGFAMNMRRELFRDPRVRKALAHLLDRERMNRTLMYGQYFMHRSYFEDLYTPGQPCTNAAFGFDKDRARALLAKAGWAANPKTGILEKDGRPFEFAFLTRDSSSSKFLSIYAEDLRDAGIRMSIDVKDAAAWSRDMDEFNYDMTWAAWGGGLFRDPEDMWSSREADRRSGNNVTGFKDPRVDALIARQRTIFDLAERNQILRDIDAIVTAQCPYVLLWNINVVRLLYWNKFGTPPAVLSKYGDERSAYWYWWYDEDSAADLDEAMKSGAALPARKDMVIFDEATK